MKPTCSLLSAIFCLVLATPLGAAINPEDLYSQGALPATDSHCCVRAGDKAPDFALKSLDGKTVSPRDYLGKKNVLISFVPAAWTPVCSKQWPGYNIAQELFEAHDTVILGISTDNLPTLYAWTQSMGGLWFPVLSDFWPHGGAARTFGLLRSDGTAERALILIDTQGIIRYVDVHDINERPRLEDIMQQLERLD